MPVPLALVEALGAWGCPPEISGGIMSEWSAAHEWTVAVGSSVYPDSLDFRAWVNITHAAGTSFNVSEAVAAYGDLQIATLEGTYRELHRHFPDKSLLGALLKELHAVRAWLSTKTGGYPPALIETEFVF